MDYQVYINFGLIAANAIMLWRNFRTHRLLQQSIDLVTAEIESLEETKRAIRLKHPDVFFLDDLLDNNKK